MAWEIVIILSLVQGITEFLPISSSAHLILIPKIFAQITTETSFDVSLHFGSLLAVIIYLRDDIREIVFDTLSPNRSNKKGYKLFKNLIISTIPVILFGFIISFYAIDIIKNIKVIGWATLVFGILLGIADKYANLLKSLKEIETKDSILIGLMQTLALIPGTSRSGIVITTGLFMGFNRYDASRFSLLLSIPVIIGATSLESISLYSNYGFFLTKEMIVGIILSFLFALTTIIIFMKWINRASLKIFVIYRVILGIVILALAYY
jgi:undecaprenyl-diphosphatase